MPESDVQGRARRRRFIERSWVVLIVLYTVVRVGVAFVTLDRYGRWPVIIFGVIDLGTAVPYAIGSARMVTSWIDHDHQAAVRWGLVASTCFLAPYAWLLWSGRGGRYPLLVYVALVLFLVCFGANAVMGIRRRVRAGAEG